MPWIRVVPVLIDELAPSTPFRWFHPQFDRTVSEHASVLAAHGTIRAEAGFPMVAQAGAEFGVIIESGNVVGAG